jgi:glucose-1-phosphate adenylyltransferase
MVLAGARGRRLDPLTRDRAKPAIPFGGQYRLIDFTLSNLVNGGYLHIFVLTQYKSHSLNRHLAQTWRMSPLLGNYVAPVPPQQRRGARFFQGSADALYQNFNLIRDEAPDLVGVFSADHIYRVDPHQMVIAHLDSGAGMTIAGKRVPVAEAGAFGVIEADSRGNVTSFREKPSDPDAISDDPNYVFASMGDYVFSTATLTDVITEDAHDDDSNHEIGGDIVPRLVASGEVHLYDFATNEVPGSTERDSDYWRDVGTLDAFHDAHMDLVTVDPVFNLYNREWPTYTWNEPAPPAKFVFDEDTGRRGVARESMVSQGVIVAGGTVRRSVLSPGVRVRSYSTVEESVLMHGVTVGRHAVVRGAIVDKYVNIPEGAQIGVDLERDRGRFLVTDGGIVVIGKGDKVDP